MYIYNYQAFTKRDIEEIKLRVSPSFIFNNIIKSGKYSYDLEGMSKSEDLNSFDYDILAMYFKGNNLGHFCKKLYPESKETYLKYIDLSDTNSRDYLLIIKRFKNTISIENLNNDYKNYTSDY